MPAPERPHSTASKFRLLYLGNDLEFIAALHQLLTELDYRLVACSDWGGAVLFLESDIPYDLLLIDLDWRGKEGLELAKLASSLPHRKRMPILLLSATKIDRHRRATAHKVGIEECALKTSDVVEVIKRLIVNE
jgi:CheY-like chemotaxis protein